MARSPNQSITSQFLAILFIALFSGLFGGAVVWGVFHYDGELLRLGNSTPFYTERAPSRDLIRQAALTDEDIANSRRNAIVQAADIVGEAVVTISATQTYVVQRYDPFYEHFFGGFFRDALPKKFYKERIPSLGSGFILNREGYVLTNEHVVENAEEIMVTLPDGREYEAILVGADRAADIAVLKIEATDLPYVTLGDSDELIIGEWAIAIGNPFGNYLNDTHPTVTVGVISALKRDFKPQRSDDRAYRNMIQTDAAINPGNSGGPLVNSLGDVIGINTFIFTETGGNIGIGFAIPINYAKQVFEEIITYGDVREVWIGLEVHTIAPAVARYLNLENNEGLIVTRVEKNSSAEEAGFKVADVIKQIDGTPIRSYQDADAAFSGKHVGDRMTCLIERDGKRLELVMTLKSLPK